MTAGETTLSAADRDWRLFEDWCVAASMPSIPVTIEVVQGFLAEFDAAPSTKHRIVRSIRSFARSERLAIDFPPQPSPSTVRSGDEWASVREALAQLPTTRFPVGLRGRRDGWVLLTLGELGLTRRQVRALQPVDVQVSSGVVNVAGSVVERDADPRRCPACAATRWLRVVEAACAGRRAEVREQLYVESDGSHDCAVPVFSPHPSASLLPAIDRHGWVHAGRPMTLNAISVVMRFRQRLGERPVEYTAPVLSGRFMHLTSAELADAYDEVDAQLTELLARTELVLGEGAHLAQRLELLEPEE